MGGNEWSNTELDTSGKKSRSAKESPIQKPSSVQGDVSQSSAAGQGNPLQLDKAKNLREKSHLLQASVLKI